MFLDAKINDYLNKLSSKEPVPGGGSAAALTGSLGTALLNKAANFSIGKEKYMQSEPEIKKILSESNKYLKEFEKLIDEDAIAYQKVSSAYKLPENTQEEKKKKTSAVEQALREALQVPLSVSRIAGQAIKLCRPLLEKGNINLASDVGVAAEFLNAAFHSAALNIEVNLAGIKDASLKKDIDKELSGNRQEIDALKEEIIKRTRENF